MEPALLNVEASLESFFSIEIDRATFEGIKKNVDSVKTYDDDDRESMASPDDEALYEKLMQSWADLATLASVVSGETPSAPSGETEWGVKKFGEKFGHLSYDNYSICQCFKF